MPTMPVSVASMRGRPASCRRSAATLVILTLGLRIDRAQPPARVIHDTRRAGRHPYQESRRPFAGRVERLVDGECTALVQVSGDPASATTPMITGRAPDAGISGIGIAGGSICPSGDWSGQYARASDWLTSATGARAVISSRV